MEVMHLTRKEITKLIYTFMESERTLIQKLDLFQGKIILFLSPSFQYKFIPENSSINTHGPGIDYEFYRNKLNGLTDYDIDIDYNFRLINSSSILGSQNQFDLY